MADWTVPVVEIRTADGRVGPSARHQHVLDLSHPDVHAYLLKALDELVDTYAIAYLKWDHSRELHEAVRPRDGSPVAHAQVAPPAWLPAALDGWIDVPGAVLATAGLPMPTLNPGQALLIEIRRRTAVG